MVSNQIIDVINELCDKFGIAIDWSQKNVQPYLESLVTKAVSYEFYTSVMWIVIGVIILGIGWFYLSKANKCKKRYIKYKCDHMIDTESDGIWKDLYRILAWFLFIIAILLIVCNANDIIKCITFPDKVMFDLIDTYLNYDN